jgi:hypothetical protein
MPLTCKLAGYTLLHMLVGVVLAGCGGTHGQEPHLPCWPQQRHLFGSLAAEAQLNHILTAVMYDLTT